MPKSLLNALEDSAGTGVGGGATPPFFKEWNRCKEVGGCNMEGKGRTRKTYGGEMDVCEIGSLGQDVPACSVNTCSPIQRGCHSPRVATEEWMGGREEGAGLWLSRMPSPPQLGFGQCLVVGWGEEWLYFFLHKHCSGHNYIQSAPSQQMCRISAPADTSRESAEETC